MPDSFGNPTINEVLERLASLLAGVTGDDGQVKAVYPYTPLLVPQAHFPFIYLHVLPSIGGMHAAGKPYFSWQIGITLALKSIEADRLPEDVVKKCYSYILPIVTALAAHLKLGDASKIALIDGSITDWRIAPPSIVDLGGTTMAVCTITLTVQQFVLIPVGI